MRKMISAIAMIASLSAVAGAQMNHMNMNHGDSTHAMKTPCPLHLTTLGLSAAQQTVVDSLAKEHQAAMKPMMAANMASMGAHDMKPGQPMKMAMKMSPADKAAMESSMKLTLDAVRAILTPAQRTTFDAAVTAHEAEMKAREAKGEDCSTCCMPCCADHDMMSVPKAGKPNDD